MVDFLNTRIGTVLENAKLLSESQAWIELWTPELKSKLIREWIQQDQLTRRGVDKFGRVIGFYSIATEEMTFGRKKAGDHYTLEDTSAFYRSMFIIVLANEILIEADSQKMEDKDWWKDEILELTDENLEKLVAIARAKYTDYIRRVLGLL